MNPETAAHEHLHELKKLLQTTLDFLSKIIADDKNCVYGYDFKTAIIPMKEPIFTSAKESRSSQE